MVRPTLPLLPEEKLLTVGQLANLLPGGSASGHPYRGTVRRWAKEGVTIKGRTIRLPVVVTPGGQRLVRWGDYVAFQKACEEARGAVPSAAEIETPAARDRALNRGLDVLDRALGGHRKTREARRAGKGGSK